MASIRIQTQTEPETPPTDKVVIYIDVADGILTSKDSSAVVSKYLLNSPALNAMTFKGVIDCSANPNYPAADAGDTYKVSVAGKIGGASGVNVEAGDILLCIADGTVSGNQATVGMYWSIEQANIDGAVIGPASAVNNRVVFFDGTSGKLIKDSGLTLSGSNSGDQTSIVGITGTKAQFNTACTDGDFLFVGDITQYTDEMVDDRVAALIQNGTGLSWTYVDGSNTLTGNVSLASFSTTNLSEGTNKYYTDGRVDVEIPVAIHAATSKATPVDADELALSDSAASFALKKLTWLNLKATLKTYFDTLYNATQSYTSTDQVITSAGALTLTHGLSNTPQRVSFQLICQTGEFGYTAGDIVNCNDQADEGQDTGMAVIVDATNVLIRYGAKSPVFKGTNFTTGVRVNLTNANWELRAFATRMN